MARRNCKGEVKKKAVISDQWSVDGRGWELQKRVLQNQASR